MKRQASYTCTNCSRDYLRLENPCRQCKSYNSIIEKQSSALTNSAAATSARRIRRRSKDSERSIAKRMAAVDGLDPTYDRVASKNGRVGFINNMRVDVITRAYTTENKNRALPKWLIDAYILICQRAKDFDKRPLLHVEASNAPRDYPSQGMKVKLDTMAIIPQADFEDLLRAERAANYLIACLSGNPDISEIIEEANSILLGRNKD